MTLQEIDSLLDVCKRHGVIAVEHEGFKAQFGPMAYEKAMPPTPPDEVRRKEADPEAVMAALHLGGGDG